MDAQHAAREWLAMRLAWEARLVELRRAYAERNGWDRYPANTWNERAAA